MMMSRKAFVEGWFQRVWTEENPGAIDELFHPDGNAKGLGGKPLVGVDGFKQFHCALCALITDIHFTVLRCLEG